MMKHNHGLVMLFALLIRLKGRIIIHVLIVLLDRILQMLREKGIGLEHKQAAVITQDTESRLWETGVIGCHSPQSYMQFLLQW